MGKYPRPKIGDRYGEWVVLSAPLGPSRHARVSCKCSCGKIAEVQIGHLVSGRSKRCRSCGYKTPVHGVARERNLVLALAADHTRANAAQCKYRFVPRSSRLRLQRRMYQAVDRCHNPRCVAYHNYGGRGISVCDEWRENYVGFAKYLMTLPGWDDLNLQIDRINNNGNYEPGNLRFVTCADNLRNRR